MRKVKMSVLVLSVECSWSCFEDARDDCEGSGTCADDDEVEVGDGIDIWSENQTRRWRSWLRYMVALLTSSLFAGLEILRHDEALGCLSMWW